MAKKNQQGVSGNPAKAAEQRTGSTPKGAGASSGRAAPRPIDPDRSKARARFEQFSAPILFFLAGTPRWLFPVLMGLLLLAGMLVPSTVVGGILLSVLVVILMWLLVLSWPLISTSAKVLRVFVLAGVALVTFGRFTGRFG